MISLIVTLAVVGFLVWIITTYVPMDPRIKTAIYVVALICIAFYLLSAFGLLHHSHDVSVPQLN